jgi:hypothetical protein
MPLTTEFAQQSIAQMTLFHLALSIWPLQNESTSHELADLERKYTGWIDHDTLRETLERHKNSGLGLLYEETSSYLC